jgi:hypothetical protein
MQQPASAQQGEIGDRWRDRASPLHAMLLLHAHILRTNQSRTRIQNFSRQQIPDQEISQPAGSSPLPLRRSF